MYLYSNIFEFIYTVLRFKLAVYDFKNITTTILIYQLSTTVEFYTKVRSKSERLRRIRILPACIPSGPPKASEYPLEYPTSEDFPNVIAK